MSSTKIIYDLGCHIATLEINVAPISSEIGTIRDFLEFCDTKIDRYEECELNERDKDE